MVLDIPDYQVPSVEATIEALVETFKILREDGVIYVGCFGGIGRTGMFMALIASIAAVDRMVHPPLKGLFGHLWAEFFGLSVYKKTPDWCKAVRSDPISYIRAAYMPHAVETEDQKKFIHLFPIMENLEKIVPQR